MKKMHHSKFAAIVLAFAVAVSLGLSSCQSAGSSSSSTSSGEKKKIVRIGFPSTNGFLGVAAALPGIAQEKKYFETELNKVGYAPEYDGQQAGAAISEALASNKVDVAFYSDFASMVLKSKGFGLDLLGITEDRYDAQVVVKKDSSIASIKDLKGKKIGYTKGTFVEKYFLELLKENGMTANDVHLINVTTDGQSSLLSGNIDAWASIAQQTIKLSVEEKQVKTLDSTTKHPDLSAQMVFVGADSYVKANPKAAVAIIKALIDARDYFKKNPNESYQILTKTGLSAADVKSLYGIYAPNFDLFTIDVTKNSIKRLKETQQFMLNQNLLTKSFNVSDWVNNSYYEQAIK